MHSPHQEVEGLVLSVPIITYLPCIWLTNNLILFKCSPVICTRTNQLDAIPTGHGGATKDNNAIDLEVRVEVPGRGPGESYTGLNLGPYSSMANGQKKKRDTGGLL